MRATAALMLGFVLAACQAAAPATQAPTQAPPTGASTQGPSPTAGPTEAPSPRPPTGLIVFQRTGTGIFTIEPSGAGETRLLSGEYQNPRWSPDGQRIALSHILDDEHGIVVPAIAMGDGTEVHDLPLGNAGLHCGSPVWDPLGTQLALECWGDDAKVDGMYLLRASDGSGLRRVTTGHGIPGGFSPDGAWLVFTDPDGMLAVVRLDGSAAQRVGSHEVGAYPGFMPGGTSIYAVVDGSITVFDLRGNMIATVRAPEAKMAEVRLSSDATQFVFVYDPLVVPSPGLARIGVDGQGFADILRATVAGSESVAPDWRS